MQVLINLMQNAFCKVGGSPGLSALFLAGLVFLWYAKFENKVEIGYIFWYSFVMLLVIVFPGYQLLTAFIFPALANDYMFTWIIPVAPVVLFVIAEVNSKIQENFRKILFSVCAIGLMILAAATSFKPDGLHIVHGGEYVSEDSKIILENIISYADSREMESIYVWAADEIVEDARIYSGRINLLYGKDLWDDIKNPVLPKKFEYYTKEAYLCMNNPSDYLDMMALYADEKQIDMIVISLDEFYEYEISVPESICEKYVVYYENDKYCIYVKTRY